MRSNSRTEGIKVERAANMLTITIPMRINRRPGRKMILTPDGGPTWAPPRREVDDTIVRALARAHRWKRKLEAGEYSSGHELAAAEGITHSFVCRLLRLMLLAPDIIEAILDGTLRRELRLADLLQPLPTIWSEQRLLLGLAPAEELKPRR